MTAVRQAAVAGTFYPGDAPTLRETVDILLAEAGKIEKAAKIIIAPHAGYIYSGPIAASAFKQLENRSEITRVVLFGPAHRVYFEGIALPAVNAFSTPLGLVPLDTTPIPGVISHGRAHENEHCIEVELPFLQTALPRPFTLVPLLCGDVSPEHVAQVMTHVWGGPETLIVISSDLSHYLPYAAAQEVDRATAEEVVGLRAHLTHEQACGATPVNAALLVAKEHGLQARLLDLRSSGDTAGDKGRVVGYASFAIG